MPDGWRPSRPTIDWEERRWRAVVAVMQGMISSESGQSGLMRGIRSGESSEDWQRRNAEYFIEFADALIAEYHKTNEADKEEVPDGL